MLCRVLCSKRLGMSLHKLYPVVEADMSDSGCVDNVLEFLFHTSDRSLPECMLMMVPEAWEADENMQPHKKHFYKFNSFVMEPWDGPALLAFSDGRYVYYVCTHSLIMITPLFSVTTPHHRFDFFVRPNTTLYVPLFVHYALLP